MSIGTGWIADLWASDPGLVTAVTAGLVVALVVAVAWPLVWLARTGKLNAKLQIGTALVQAGMTAAVVSGTYEFFHTGFGLPVWEAIAFGIFLEAATWVAVGKVLEHAREHDGMGYGGVAFWVFSLVGGFLAVLAGDTPGEVLGRAAIVTVGTGLWFLTLLTKTKPGRLARRLLIAVGALHAEDADVPAEHREWQIRRLTRAIRWSNSRGPLRWLGRRALVALAERTTEDAIDEAQRRYAYAHLLVDSVSPTSEVMASLLDGIRDEATPSRRAELEQMRAEIEQARAELEQARHQDRLENERLNRELIAAREEFTAERARALAAIDQERAALAAARQRVQTSAPTKDVPPAGQNPESPAGGDVDPLVRDVAKWIETERAAKRPHGQRPVAEHFKVGRARASELIAAAEALLQPQVNGKHYPIPTTGATP